MGKLFSPFWSWEIGPAGPLEIGKCAVVDTEARIPVAFYSVWYNKLRVYLIPVTLTKVQTI